MASNILHALALGRAQATLLAAHGQLQARQQHGKGITLLRTVNGYEEVKEEVHEEAQEEVTAGAGGMASRTLLATSSTHTLNSHFLM